MAMIYPFMQSLREAPFPAPGNTVKIKSFIPESGTEVLGSGWDAAAAHPIALSLSVTFINILILSVI